MEKPYVIIVHRPTLRAFTLNRNYGILCKDFEIEELPKNAVEEQEGWLPTFGYQRPEWLDFHHNYNKDFTAYWMY